MERNSLPEKGKKSLPINPETHRKMKGKAGELGLFVTDLVDEMWRRYEESLLPAPKAEQSKTVARRHTEWHALLDTILDHGTKEDIVGIQANLRWGAESVSKRHPQPRSRAAG